MKFLATAAAAALISTAALAEDIEVFLVNDSSADLVAFSVSPASANQWQDNLLGETRLQPGYEIGVLIADGLSTCIYDIRADFADGTGLDDFGVDLCEMESYTFYD
ncbi:hypothetical protein [Shimia biformata]|uniref:hypothetical protein n=1 Tax=Shimia biformata TaxID=1294299 RepID=UPI00194EE87E|nr:hypothetical protein [Shimia biformata]